MTFEEAEKYLYSLGNEVEAMKLGLENIRTLLGGLGDPHKKYKKVQVAGTNGKGSVCAFLDSICREAGIRTGLYTSPHLVSITERIKIDGTDIAEADFARLVSRVRETAETLFAEGKITYIPTYFEQVTAVALVAFAEANIDLAILETGMGGRLDATTAAEAEIVAITQIALDHQEYLGDTIEEIAGEKAAIIGESTTVAVIGPQLPEVNIAIDDRLDDIRNPELKIVRINAAGSMPYELGLKGKHQVENAKIAVELARILAKEFDISETAVRLGLTNARHPGRLEYAGNTLYDGAHNIGGAKALRDFLKGYEKREITMIFGAMKDKNVAEMAEILFPMAQNVVLTRPENSRAMEPEDIAAMLPDDLKSRTVATHTVREAITKAGELSSPGGLILVTGSLYLVGEVKKLLNN